MMMVKGNMDRMKASLIKQYGEGVLEFHSSGGKKNLQGKLQPVLDLSPNT